MAEDPRAHHAQVPGALRGSPQEPPGQRGLVPVQEHLPAGLCEITSHISSQKRVVCVVIMTHDDLFYFILFAVGEHQVS